MSRKTIAVAALLLVGCAMYVPPASAGDDPAPAAPAAPERPVDLCLCLDTSNSMDGLIDSARRKLWDIVNDLSRVQPTPRLRVALDLVAAIPGEFEGAATSAYLSYADDKKTWTAPLRVRVDASQR